MSKALNRLIAAVLAFVLAICAMSVRVRADGDGQGKYVSDVYIAYAESEKEAVKWLKDNGWEPIKGDNDFNAGKPSYWDDSKGHRDYVAVAMGIKRTSKASDAITDMAVMNMTGGYNFPAYEELLEQKKTEIDEFINSFMPVIKEFRENYNGTGSDYGKRRAEIANELLNKLYDGDPDGEYAVNDTGKKLGELFRDKLRGEGNTSGGDLQQIILESSGAAVSAIEQLLILASDSGQESWLERLQGLSGDELAENLPKYVPEAAGQKIAPSAVTNLLRQNYSDSARKIASGWREVHDRMLWYENYNESNDLWQHDGEGDDEYAERAGAYFAAIEEEDEAEFRKLWDEYSYYGTLYNALYETEYEGPWGETLGDFFNPYDGTDYSRDADNFLTLAAAMSPGQRAALELVTLSSLLLMGVGDETGLDYIIPNLDELLGDDTSISVYSGINRGIFRAGVAITSEALMEQNMGRGNAFDRIWDHTGIVSIVSYVGVVVGIGMMIAGGVMMAKGVNVVFKAGDQKLSIVTDHEWALKQLAEAKEYVKQGFPVQSDVAEWEMKVEEIESKMVKETQTTRLGYAGRAVLAIGGIILLGAAFLKGYQMYKYYQRTFTKIPLMIVDESDIVTYLTDEDGKPLLDEKGNQKKSIDFKDYQYYEVVSCNRQEVGNIGDWQDGVGDYDDWGCGDAADLNADMGQEWLALYTVKSPDKGDPILADSLTLQYGSDEQPEGTTKCLHFFEYTYPIDLGDTAYSYNNKKGGVYFFWDEDAEAENNGVTASAFSAGHMAMVGAVGLVIGILAATFVLLPQRKKETLD